MKVLMIVNTDGALYVFRKPIITKLIELGHEVLSISSKDRHFEKLRELGVKPISLNFSRHSVSIIENLFLLFKLFSLIKSQRADVVHSFTHKPAIYGSVAAKLAGVASIYVTITGLGTLFMRNNVIARLLRWLLLIQYRIALRFATTVFFQNPDDMNLFVSNGIVDQSKVMLTNGSGIDLEEYYCPSTKTIADARLQLSKELGIDLSRRKVVLFPARGVREKGFVEFYEAAKIISVLEPDSYLFIHLGLIDSNSSGQIKRESVEEYARNSRVYYLGYKDDIQVYMTAADIVALPSYGEGTPRSLLEALALGKAIVTTDVPGCRETLIDGWNGFLCKVKDSKSLASKILTIDFDFIAKARLRSRRFGELKYDVKELVELTINLYKENLRKN